MRQTSTAFVTAILAASSFAMPAAAAAVRFGSWTAISNEPGLPARCMAITTAVEEGGLLATVGELGVIKFMFTSKRLSLSPNQPLKPEFLVDGRTIELEEARVLNDGTVGFVGTAKGRLDGSLLQAVEAGERAVIQLAGIRATFELDGSRQAMEMISLCDANGGVMPDAAAVTSRSTLPSSGSSGATPASDGGRIGDWLVYPAEPYFDGGCLAARMNSEGAGFLLHQDHPQDGVSFGISSAGSDLRDGWRGPATLVVDDQPIGFSNIRAIDPSTVFSVRADDSTDFINRLRSGSSAAFEFEGQNFRFDLQGFAKAIPTFAECVAAHDRTFASVLSGNRTNNALGMTLAPKADADAGSLEVADVEEEGAPNKPFDADAVATLLNRDEAYAQLRCSIPAINFVGLYGANVRAAAFDISINDDATALVNGTSLTPVGHRTAPGDAGPSVSIYRASDVFGAISKSPLAGMLANSPRPPQDAFEESFLGLLANPGSLVPENRLLSLSLVNNEVTVADQLANGQLGNVTAHRCYRLR